jgi:hypothetical protein
MSRKNVRVEINTSSPDDFVNQSKLLLKKHKELGDESPLRILDMGTFEAKLADADAQREESKTLKNKSEIKMQEAMINLGIGKGQTIDTPGTIYHLLTQSRDLLLSINKGKEEALSEWGLKTVVTTSTPGRKKTV